MALSGKPGQSCSILRKFYCVWVKANPKTMWSERLIFNNKEYFWSWVLFF